MGSSGGGVFLPLLLLLLLQEIWIVSGWVDGKLWSLFGLDTRSPQVPQGVHTSEKSMLVRTMFLHAECVCCGRGTEDRNEVRGCVREVAMY